MRNALDLDTLACAEQSVDNSVHTMCVLYLFLSCTLDCTFQIIEKSVSMRWLRLCNLQAMKGRCGFGYLLLMFGMFGVVGGGFAR